MTTKVSNNVPIISSEKLDWKLTKKVDSTTGKPVGEGAEKSDKELPKNQLQAIVNKSLPKGSNLQIKKPELSNIPELTTPRQISAKEAPEKSIEHSENYQKMRGQANKFDSMSLGKPKEVEKGKEPVKQAEVKHELSTQSKSSLVVSRLPLVTPTTNNQRPTTNDRRPTTNDQRPTTNDRRPTTKEESKNNGESAAQKKVAKEALSFGQQVSHAPKETKESTQLKEKTADNDNEGKKGKKNGSLTARGKAKEASRDLGGILAGQNGGLGSSTTTTSDDVELTADATEPVEAAEAAKNSGVAFYNAEEADAKFVETAVKYYGDVEKPKKEKIPLDKKIANYTDKELAKRFIIETKKQLALAQLLIEQLRNSGGPSGYGKSA